MKFFFSILIMAGLLTSVLAEPAIKFNFNNFEDGPVDGQFEWNVYDKVKDSSAISIMNELGTSEALGDKALVIQAAHTPIRCVTGEPVRWLPGSTLTVEFDFKVAVAPEDLLADKPVMTIMVGNSLLSEKARFSARLEASLSGDWVLSGEFPDSMTKKIYGENYLIRSQNDVSIADWFRFSLVVKKLEQPDSFEASIEIRHPQSGKLLTAATFTDENKNKVSAAMWNTTRAHAGFYASRDQYGLVCIDNFTFSSDK